jgi:hypothetical protein
MTISTAAMMIAVRMNRDIVTADGDTVPSYRECPRRALPIGRG